jgi:hypothetical protein
LDTFCAAITDDAVNELVCWLCVHALGNLGNAAAVPALETVAKRHPTETLGNTARAVMRELRR